MIKIYENPLLSDRSLARYIYMLFPSCMNSDTNRLEFNGLAMNTIDVCAYANITNSELCKVMKRLYFVNAIITIRGKGKEFYYINPRFIREESRDVFSFEWLLELFDEEPNHQDKNLVYFKKNKKGISINVGDNLPK